MNDFHHGPLSIDHAVDEFGKDRFFVHDDLSGDWLGEPFDSIEAAAEEIERMHALPPEEDNS